MRAALAAIAQDGDAGPLERLLVDVFCPNTAFIVISSYLSERHTKNPASALRPVRGLLVFRSAPVSGVAGVPHRLLHKEQGKQYEQDDDRARAMSRCGTCGVELSVDLGLDKCARCHHSRSACQRRPYARAPIRSIKLFSVSIPPPQRSPNRSGARPLWLVAEQGLRGLARSAAARGARLGPGPWLPAPRSSSCCWCPPPRATASRAPRWASGPVAELERTHALDFGRLAGPAAPGTYRFAGTFSAVGATQLTLGWEYGSYRFTRYRKPPADCPRSSRRRARTSTTCGSRAKRWRGTRSHQHAARTIWGPRSSARPCSDSRCSTRRNAGSSSAMSCCARTFHSSMRWAGQRARAAAHRPALGQTRRAAASTLVGKGVCFDTGGLDIKPQRHAAHEEGHGRRGAACWRSRAAHGRGCARPVARC